MSDRVFFSYSRYDSAFALKLANDLRNAGATIWLDQLDIPPGKHWDSEIEEALNSSNCLLAILSPKSMLSNNAMDEISYALEENKKVIPILLTDTETPFRLRRLQRVDFTGDYDIAFRQLLGAIDIDIEKSQPAKAATINPEKLPASDAPADKGLREPKEDQKESNDWAKTRSINTITGYQDYLKTTSSDKHKDEAGYYSNKLEAESLVRPEINTGNRNIRGFSKKYVLITAGFSTLAVIGFAAFLLMNRGPDIKDVHETVNPPVQNVVETKDTTKKESVDIVTQVPDPDALARPNITSDKKASVAPAKEEASTEKNQKPKQTEKQTAIIQKQTDTTQQNRTPDPAPILPKTDELKIEPAPKPAPATEKLVSINSDLLFEMKLIENPDMDKGRAEQPVTFSVTRDVTIDGTTIIRQGAIANGRIIVGMRFIGLRINQVAGANGKMIPIRSKESDLKKREVKKDNVYTAIIKKGTKLLY
jgi:hypothetical protein